MGGLVVAVHRTIELAAFTGDLAPLGGTRRTGVIGTALLEALDAGRTIAAEGAGAFRRRRKGEARGGHRKCCCCDECLDHLSRSPLLREQLPNARAVRIIL